MIVNINNNYIYGKQNYYTITTDSLDKVRQVSVQSKYINI